MTNEALTAWLGGGAAELTADQLDRIERIWDELGEQYPADDQADERNELMAASVQYLLGETTIDEAGAARAAARAEAQRTSAVAQHLALMAIEDGMSETEAARRSTVDRMWLRKRLGK